MSENHIAKAIQLAMKTMGIKGRELARLSGLTFSTLHRLTSDNDNDPRASNIISICKTINISADELLGLKKLSPHLYSKEITILNNYENYLPLLTMEEASHWNHTVNDIYPDKWKKWYKTDLKTSQKAFTVYVSEQKAPIIPENSIIIVEPEFKIEEDILILVNTKGYPASIRRVIIEEPHIYLQSLNNQLPPTKKNKDQRIIGKIIQIKVNYEN